MAKSLPVLHVATGYRVNDMGRMDPIDAIANLREYAFERFDVDGIEKERSAELFEPTDGLPLIGRSPAHENLWVATGLSGVGLTLGTMAGVMIAKQIIGEETKLKKELSPTRFSLRDLGHVITEQSQTLPDYAERILPAETIDAASIPAGEGLVGNDNGKRSAVCRDRDGNLHIQSPICTHRGGMVRWNPFEQTWDCPVHGVRFSKCGIKTSTTSDAVASAGWTTWLLEVSTMEGTLTGSGTSRGRSEVSSALTPSSLAQSIARLAEF